MRALSRHRVWQPLVSGWLIAVLLFTQLATASYACPQLAPAAGRCRHRDGGHARLRRGMPASMDPEQPQLCKAHCESGKTSVNSQPGTLDVPGPWRSARRWSASSTWRMPRSWRPACPPRWPRAPRRVTPALPLLARPSELARGPASRRVPRWRARVRSSVLSSIRRRVSCPVSCSRAAPACRAAQTVHPFRALRPSGWRSAPCPVRARLAWVGPAGPAELHRGARAGPAAGAGPPGAAGHAGRIDGPRAGRVDACPTRACPSASRTCRSPGPIAGAPRATAARCSASR
jgi:hypothetical protein